LFLWGSDGSASTARRRFATVRRSVPPFRRKLWNARAVLRATLRALAAPRRAVPVVLVAVPVLYLQQRYSGDPLGLPLGVALVLLFLLTAPAAWRSLFPATEGVRDGFVRLGLYGAVGVAVIATAGSVLPRLLGMPPTFMTTRPSLLVCLGLYWAGGWGLARDIDLEEGFSRERARAERLSREREEARLLALRNHLDPHFLFNTLNAIAEWCREDGLVAEQAILRLSEMLRAVLAGIQEERWPLAKEVAIVRDLFELHRIRDPDAFRLQMDVPSELPDVRVPPMLFLPAAENAMKHGPGAGHRGEVSFALSDDGGALVVTIENPGEFRGPRQGGHGLEILRKRVASATDGRGSVTMSAIATGGPARTRTTITLPKGSL